MRMKSGRRKVRDLRSPADRIRDIRRLVAVLQRLHDGTREADLGVESAKRLLVILLFDPHRSQSIK
jgi:hypothetical protein